MHRKKLIAVVALVLSITFVIIILGTKGTSLQSSLLGEATSSGGVIFNFSQDGNLKELPVDAERNLIYTLLLNSGKNQGFYFPRVYSVSDSSKGLLAIAYKNQEYVSFEQKIQFDVHLPKVGVRYIGNSNVNFDGYNGVVTQNNDERILHIELQALSTSPKIIDKSLDPIILLPIEVSYKSEIDLRIQITSASQTNFAGATMALPFFEQEGEIHQVPAASLANTTTTLPKIINQVYTSPIGSPKNVVYTTTAGLQYPNVPEIIAAQTNLQPIEIKEGDENPIYIYVAAKDQDGVKDLDYVLIDLTSLGLSKNTKLLENNATADGIVYSTNFVLPSGVKAKNEPYVIPFTVYDKENHHKEGTVSLVVKKGKRSIDLDLDANGVIDIKDLTLYINAYQAATK